MPFKTQEVNATTKLLTALDALREAFWQCVAERDRAKKIGVPADANQNYPPPGDLDHLTFAKLTAAQVTVDALQTWMDTTHATVGKKPMDALVEALR